MQNNVFTSLTKEDQNTIYVMNKSIDSTARDIVLLNYLFVNFIDLIDTEEKGSVFLIIIALQ